MDWSGAYTTIDGRPTMVLPVRTLRFPSLLEQTAHHELGHAVDLVEEGGLFSALPEFNPRIVAIMCSRKATWPANWHSTSGTHRLANIRSS